MERLSYSKYFIIISLTFFTSVGELNAQNTIDEAALKSAWLAHFSKFIEWPASTDTSQYFVIKVIGNNTFEGYLDKLYAERLIKNKQVKIAYIDSISQIGFCHILFISKNKKKELKAILSAIGNQPILTIGDTDGFAQAGVMINFYTENNRVGFEVNISTSKRIDLDVSFRLLELAKIVKDEG